MSKFRVGKSRTYCLMPLRVRLWFAYYVDPDTGKTAPAAAKDVYWEIHHILNLPSAANETWISTKRLMLLTNLQERSVQRAIKWLTKNGVLVRHEYVGHGVVYELAPGTIMSDDYLAMKASKTEENPNGFCPCAWKSPCRAHPSPVTGRKR